MIIIILLPLHMFSKYDPYSTVADIEVLCNVSHRKAERMMAEVKRVYEIPKYKHVKLSVIREYFYDIIKR